MVQKGAPMRTTTDGGTVVTRVLCYCP